MEGEEVNQLRTETRRILIFPQPLQGHVTPMLHFANILHSRGFSITIIHTRYNALDPAHFPHFTFHFLEDRLPKSAMLSSNDFKAVLSALQVNCCKPFQDCLAQILDGSVADRTRVACLISDAMWSFAGEVAQSFDLPRFVLRTGGMSAFVVYDFVPALQQKGYYPLEEAKFDQIVPELSPVRVRDLPREITHGMLATTLKETKNSQGVICNTFEELEGSLLDISRQIIPCPLFPIGPLHKYSQSSAASLWKPDQTCISWLNSQTPKTVLYVSFGSLAEIAKTEFLEMAWGLANSKQPFLWVVRPGLGGGFKLDELFPEGYAEIVGERGRIVKWAPQLEVLSHPSVGGFWTHCGWNSTVESVCEGVPFLCTPFFADQAINARYVCDSWKIGLQIEKGATREDTQKAILKLMVEKDGAEMRNRITGLQEKAKVCIAENGSSSESLERLISYLSSF